MAGGEAVAIWWIDLDAREADEALLSPDEREWAARLRLPLARRRFVAARAAVRELLARVIGSAPGELRFVAGSHGKPALAESPLAFNLSHSEGTAVLALGGERALGVDCEMVRDDAAVMRGALDPFLSPSERAEVAAWDAPRLYRLWTRKEALAKAAGTGVAFPLATATVSRDDAQPVTVAGWGCFRLHDLDAPLGIAAALCGAGEAPLVVGRTARYPG